MIEISCAIVLGVVTWMVASEGVSGAAQTFLSTLLAAIIAMNFFEPLAVVLERFIPKNYSDIAVLLGLFTVLVFALRMGGEQLAPSYIQVIPAIDSFGRWVFGAATGYLTMAFLLTSLHTGPLPREFMGFAPEKNNFFTDAPDRRWLGFVQYMSDKPLSGWPATQKIGNQEYNAHTFDGHFEKVGDPSNPYKIRNSYGQDVPQVIWPSFPIRYAMRRARLASGQSAGPPPVPVAPVPAGPPGKNPGPPPAF